MRERHVYRVEEEEGGNSWVKSGQSRRWEVIARF